MMDDKDWEPPTEAEMKLIEARRERSDKISKLMSSYLLKGYKMLGIVCAQCETILLQDRKGTNYCVACSELDSDTDKDNPVMNESAAVSMARELELAAAASATGTVGESVGEKTQPTPAVVTPSARGSGEQPLKLSSTRPNTSSFEGGAGEPLSTQKFHGSPRLEDLGPTLTMSSIDVHSWQADHERNKGQSHNIPPTINAQCNDSQSRMSAPPTSCKVTIKAEQKSSTSFSNPNDDAVLTQKYSSTSKQSSASSVPGPQGGGVSAMTISTLVAKLEWASQELGQTSSVEYSIQLCHLVKAAAEAIVAVRNARI